MVVIPGTTLVCIDCQFLALAARALMLTLAQCEYGLVKFFTDAHAVPGLDPRVRVVPVPTIASALDYSRFVLKHLVDHVDTDFVQVVQWDGYVTNGAAWRDEFFDYDYIGARWWFREDGRNVGNGGFSLRSRRLLEALRDEAIKVTDAEDNAICLVHREYLESSHGIRIAPAAVADRYSFEGTKRTGAEFGFHRAFNLPYFYGEAQLAEVLDAIPDDKFCAPGSVSLVFRLIELNRKREALRYAKRIRAQPAYAQLPGDFRGDLERTAIYLVGRDDPCPCASGIAFERCCGVIGKWSPV